MVESFLPTRLAMIKTLKCTLLDTCISIFFFNLSSDLSNCNLMVNNFFHFVSKKEKKRGSSNKPRTTSLSLYAHVLMYCTLIYYVIIVSERKGSDSSTCPTPTSLNFHMHVAHVLHFSVMQ